MKTLLEEFIASFDRGDAVLTMLVETRGSTPQKAGATMLVFRDGGQRGTLGGGCVEAEVKRQALAVLESRTSVLRTFHLNHDYGWDDGLICGGRMTALIEPAGSSIVQDYYRTLLELLERGDGVTEAVALAEPAGEQVPRALFDGDDRLVASIGAISRVGPRSLSQRPRPYVADGIAYLPHLSRCRLLVVGAGHVGQKVTELAAQVDFDVTVVDDRADYCVSTRLPGASECVSGPLDTLLDELPIDRHTYCLIVTRGHHHDELALSRLINREAGFVGMIGSKRKIKLIFDDLRREGVSEELLERVHAPIGLDIGSQTVPEIAISIVAQLIAHRNLRSQESGVRSQESGVRSQESGVRSQE
jgi:xanthine dehydrogenase accessory factor